MSDIVLKALHLITQYFFTKTLRTISILQMENSSQKYHPNEGCFHMVRQTNHFIGFFIWFSSSL